MVGYQPAGRAQSCFRAGQAPPAGPGQVRVALQRSSAAPVAGTTTSAARARSAGRCDCPDHAQAGRPRIDQRVPQSSLRIAENTSSETVREFWHGTGLTAAQQHQPAQDPDHDQVQQPNAHEPRSCRNLPIGPNRSSQHLRQVMERYRAVAGRAGHLNHHCPGRVRRQAVEVVLAAGRPLLWCWPGALSRAH